MKILQLSSEKNWRGGEQQISYLINNLILQQHEILVVCRKGSDFENYCLKQEIPFKSISFKNSIDLSSAWQLKEICKEWKPDLIHAHSSKSYSIAWLAFTLGNKIPVILSRRVAFKISNTYFNRLKYNAACLKKIICVTEAVRQQVLPFISDKNKAIVIHDGIDLASYSFKDYNFFQKNYSIPEDAYLIGTTAAFTREKDYTTYFLTAQKVLHSVTDKKIIFIAMGEGPEKQEMQKLCKSLRISEHICFTGFIPDARNYLNHLNLFLFTSQNEGLGSSILDAIASKLPVVSTAAGGIPEIIQHKETGMLAPIGDYNKLAEHVERLIRNPELSERIAARALETLPKFDIKNITLQTTLIYQQVIKDFR